MCKFMAIRPRTRTARGRSGVSRITDCSTLKFIPFRTLLPTTTGLQPSAVTDECEHLDQFELLVIVIN